MSTKRFAFMSAIAVSAGVLLLSGCASAATPTSTSGSPGATQTSTSTSGSPAGRGTSTAGGPVNITGYSDNDGAKATVILTGVIGDFGEAVRTYANGITEKEYDQLNLVVSHGSFRLSTAGLEENLRSAFSHFPSDTSTCSGIVTATATTPIVAGSGTGAYKGVSGSFKMTITIAEVDSWPKCSALLTEDIFITGSGTVSFG